MGGKNIRPEWDDWEPSQPSGRREIDLPDFDWEDIDWLNETPEPEPPQRRAPQQQAPQRRAPQQQAPQRRAPEQQAPQRRTPQQQAPQRRASQQQAPQRRASQQQAPQRRAPQQQAPRRQAYRPAAEEPWRDDAYGGRTVAVEPEEYRPRRRWLSKQNLPLIILVVILVGGVLFAGGKLGSILLNYHRDRSAYNALADEALAGLAEPDVTTSPDATQGPEPTKAPSEVPISVDWDYLRGINTDVAGWLYCPNTAINYPVMQTSDNDYYLHRGFDRQPNTAGSLFADYNAAIGIPFSNYIVYGHNMKDGSMFATVYDYVNQEFYNQHPIMYLLTPTQNYRVELIAAHIVESTLNNYPSYFQGEGDYQNYLNQLMSSTFFMPNTAVSTQYQLITMSTCDYSSSYNDPRFLLHGLLIPVE